MKIIENKVPVKASISDQQECKWCGSIIEVEEHEKRRDTVTYSQIEIDHNVLGFDCPCCGRFTPSK